jgi:hypothetical protein
LFTKLLSDHKRRKLDRELMQLELDEQEAHAKAEFMVISAERALADAKLRAERMEYDALMIKRWGHRRVEIANKYLDKEDQAYAGTMEVQLKQVK